MTSPDRVNGLRFQAQEMQPCLIWGRSIVFFVLDLFIPLLSSLLALLHAIDRFTYHVSAACHPLKPVWAGSRST